MYEIENEDHIAIERNDGNAEYVREGYGKSMHSFYNVHWLILAFLQYFTNNAL